MSLKVKKPYILLLNGEVCKNECDEVIHLDTEAEGMKKGKDLIECLDANAKVQLVQIIAEFELVEVLETKITKFK